MSMSPAHFQRVFTAWVGVSPKRYQQYLALDHARALLRERFTTLETAGAVGLSGGGRLHDLFLTWEAMSPGTYASGGAGLAIRWGWFDSPFGRALVMGTGRGICGLGFAAETGEDATMADLMGRWPNAAFAEDPDTLLPCVEAAFGGRGAGAARAHRRAVPDQGLGGAARVPSGQVTTYSEIARGHRPPSGRPRSRHRRGPQPGLLAHPLPSRAAEVWHARRLPLGAAGQARAPRPRSRRAREASEVAEPRRSA
jgi:AraC family transcriptional regulator, regulatory protein of adaptative response / methylated-DNA-[protein]-cysteine methyltransferase